MTSTSYLGTAAVTIQFDLNRSIDGAANDVQGAINAASGQLPKNLPSPPTYRKVNPADSPILLLSATSETLPLTTVSDAVDEQLAQQISQISGVAQVIIGGQHYSNGHRASALRDLRGDSPALALHLRPELSLAQVRALLADARKAGAARVAVIARSAQYPWDRKIYWIADGVGTRAGLRPTDSLQLLLHAVDAVAGPGTIARVD